jgi:peptidoglycan/LPS O-acetylase OafA/YrhL
MGMLRILLALAVILTHVNLDGQYLVKGGDAVRLFFIISGYYMGMILSGKYGTEKEGINRFYANRFLRLMPMYYVVLALTMGWQIFCLTGEHGHSLARGLHAFGETFAGKLAWLPNYTLVGLDSSYYFDKTPTGLAFHTVHIPPPGDYWLHEWVWVPQMWSVAAEMWFYAFAPSLVRLPIKWLAFVCLISFDLQLYLTYFVSFDPGYCFWGANIYLFGLGVMVYRLRAHLKLSPSRPALGFLIGAAAVLALTLFPLLHFRFPLYLMEACCALFIPTLFALTQRSGFDRFVGNLSYPIYCCHFLGREWAKTLIGHLNISFDWLPWMTIVVTIPLSIALYYGVDHLVERYRQKISARAWASSHPGASKSHLSGRDRGPDERCPLESEPWAVPPK